MNTKLIFPVLLASFVITVSSCSSDEPNTPADVIDTTPTYSIPATYSFKRNNVSTVDFSGQTTRIKMLEEMGNVFKTAATDGTVISETILSDMYENKNNRFIGIGLNESGKQLKNKTAASVDYFSLFLGGGSSPEQVKVRNDFESTFKDGNLASQGALAAAGVAGIYTDGASKRLFAANGLEPQQVFLKGMMGAFLLDQIVNNYLSVNKLDESNNKANNTNKVLEDKTNYTTMEHNWDEAFGYVYGADDATAAKPVYKFWSSYINQVNADSDFNTVASDIETAFRTGRAAITNNDYSYGNREGQINIIKDRLALVAAVRAVYYLQEGKGKLLTDNGAKSFHALSEAYGFIMCLRYTSAAGISKPYFTKAEVDTMLATLTSGTNGLWDIDTLSPQLDKISTLIANRFSFTVAQAATVN